MDWYLYGTSLLDDTTTVVLTENKLDAWVYGEGAFLSGLARDFTLTEKSTVLFSISLDAHSGTDQREVQIMLLDANDNILETHSYTFDDKGTSVKKGYRYDLESGDYTIVIGHSKKTYEVNGYEDNLKIYPYVNFTPAAATHKKSMWVWEIEEITNLENILPTYKALGVDCVYQYASKNKIEANVEALSTYISQLHENHISCYAMDGEPGWYNNIETMKTFIDSVYTYNVSHPNEKFDGIIFDIEPYASEDSLTNKERITLWRDNAREVYLYANGLGIKIIFTNPVWYSNADYAGTVLSFTTFSDGISYMNYSKSYLIENIREEVEIARDNDCWIESISELNIPSSSLDTDITFYYDGLGAVHEAWDKMKQAFNYEKMSFSYHYLSPIKRLISDYDFNFLNENSLTKLIEEELADMNNAIEIYISNVEPKDAMPGDLWLIQREEMSVE